MQRSSRFALALAVLALGLSAAAGAQQQMFSDAEIRLAIEGELWEARAVDANDIDLDVNGGIARLSGTVDNMLAKRRAVRIAQMTRGVVGVVDELTVGDSGRADAAIRADVNRALRGDPATDGWELGVRVEQGLVTLDGTVDSYAESELAERIASSIEGVRGIENDLIIDPPAVARSDQEIGTEVAQMLEWDLRLDDALISVEVEDGAVTLRGSVGSEYERVLARSVAYVEGVSSVDVRPLEVQWWLRDEMQRNTLWSDQPDSVIRDAVVRAMAYDTRVNAFEIGVTSTDGEVTLTGTVDNLKAKRAAAQDAQNTAGVWRVRNYVKVRPAVMRPDTAITADIRAALVRDATIDSGDVTVTVDDGSANLYGRVDSLFEREQAEDLVSRVNGVVNVQNYLSVAYDTPSLAYDYRDWDAWLYDYDFDYETTRSKPDAEILADIESELFWSPFVSSDDIDVSVENGVATLDGEVDNVHERRLAAQNALEGGAIQVVNELDLAYN